MKINTNFSKNVNSVKAAMTDIASKVTASIKSVARFIFAIYIVKPLKLCATACSCLVGRVTKQSTLNKLMSRLKLSRFFSGFKPKANNKENEKVSSTKEATEETN